MELDVSDSDLGDELGAGGQAVIFDLPGMTLPDLPGPLVYKRYRDGRAPRTHDMRQLVNLRTGLSDDDRDRLDGIATWPVRLVCDGPELLGVVLPRIPDSYFQPVTLPSGATKRLVREVQHLFVDDAINRRIGMPEATREQRLTICLDFAAALDFLHGPAMNVVFGDINAKNELFRLDREPTVMLVDCDAVRPHGAVTGGLQLNAPDWEPPGRSTLNRATDLYKLGLFVLRCLLPPGPQTSTRLDPAPGLLDDQGLALLTRALSDEPADRPEAGEWLRYLSLTLGRPLDPPVLSAVTLDRTLVAADEPVTVRWAATDAVTIEVAAAGVATVTIDGRSGGGTIPIRPVRTGRLTVTARNPLGEDTGATPPVFVFDLPSWTDVPVPMPRLDPRPTTFPSLDDVRVVMASGIPAIDLPPPPLTGVTGPPPPPATYSPLPFPQPALPDPDLGLTDLFLPRKGRPS